MRVIEEGGRRVVDLAGPLDVDHVGPVDHDLGDRVVLEERFERSVAEDVVGDLLDDLAALFARQRSAVEGELLGDDPEDLLREILRGAVLRLPGREELRAELRNARVVDPRLQVRVRVLRPLDGLGLLPGEGVEGVDRLAVRAVLAVESVVEPHG